MKTNKLDPALSAAVLARLRTAAKPDNLVDGAEAKAIAADLKLKAKDRTNIQTALVDFAQTAPNESLTRAARARLLFPDGETRPFDNMRKDLRALLSDCKIPNAAGSLVDSYPNLVEDEIRFILAGVHDTASAKASMWDALVNTESMLGLEELGGNRAAGALATALAGLREQYGLTPPPCLGLGVDWGSLKPVTPNDI